MRIAKKTVIHCQNSSRSLKVHLRASCTTWHCQDWHVYHMFLLYYISLLVGLLFKKPIWQGLLNVNNQTLLSFIYDLYQHFQTRFA